MSHQPLSVCQGSIWYNIPAITKKSVGIKHCNDKSFYDIFKHYKWDLR